MKFPATALAILAALSVSIALADDFKTVDGKEYKDAKVSRVEPDGLVLITKLGISKVYFTELPKEVQQKFHYDSQKAAEFTSQTVEQNRVFLQQRAEDQQKRAEERAKYWMESTAAKNLPQITIFAVIEPFRFEEHQTIAWIQLYGQYEVPGLGHNDPQTGNWVPSYEWRKAGDQFIGVIDEPMPHSYESRNQSVVTLYKIGHSNDSSRDPVFTTAKEKAVHFLATGSTE